MKVVLLGSTGLIGKNVLKLLSRLDRVNYVYCPVRTVPNVAELGILQGASKFDFEQVDFEQILDKLPGTGNTSNVQAKILGCDAVVSALEQQGSKRVRRLTRNVLTCVCLLHLQLLQKNRVLKISSA